MDAKIVLQYKNLYITKAFFNNHHYNSMHTFNVDKEIKNNHILIKTNNKVKMTYEINPSIYLNRNIIEFLKLHDIKWIQKIKIKEICINNKNDFRMQNIIQFVIEKDAYIESILIPYNMMDDIKIVNKIEYLIRKINIISNLENRNEIFISKRIDNILFTNISGGTLFHEMICHAFENDYYVISKTNIEKARTIELNNKLTVYDSNNKSQNISGLNLYDDNGNELKDFYFIKNGLINGESYGDTKQSSYGNMIAEKLYDYPLYRMRSTKILSDPFGPTSNELIDQLIKNNLEIVIILDIKFGNSFYDTLTFQLCGQVILKKDSHFFFSNYCKLFGDTIEVIRTVNNISNDLSKGVMECRKKNQNIYIDINSPSFITSNIYFEGYFKEIEDKELWTLVNI